MSDLVDKILPDGCIHLLGGPTGAGKTRWLLDMLLNWERGEKVFGLESHPVPWAYVVGDRSERETRSTIASLGIPQERIPLIPAFAPTLTVNQIFEAVEKTPARLIVWEGFGGYTDRLDGHAVKNWLSSITTMIQRDRRKELRANPLTIIGVTEQPKMKPNDRYSNPRQRISGAAAWGHCSSTILMIDPWDVEDPTGPLRRFGIYPRNHRDMEFKASLEDGHLRILESVSHTKHK